MDNQKTIPRNTKVTLEAFVEFARMKARELDQITDLMVDFANTNPVLADVADDDLRDHFNDVVFNDLRSIDDALEILNIGVETNGQAN